MFANPYWLRDLTNKAVRRAKKLLGRPDPTPWVLRPARPQSKSYVDLIVGLDFLNNNAYLTKLIHESLSPHGLSLLVANSTNVKSLTQQAKSGALRPHVYLDLCSATSPDFGDLLRALAAAGVHTVGEPETLDAWTYKARAQKKLEEAGLPVPPTVIIRADEPARDLTAEELRAIGAQCVIKPSWGVAGKGCVANQRPTRDAIEQARRFDPKDDYLVQRMIRWEKFGARTAYLRGYNIFGTRSLLWWAPESRLYEEVTWDDIKRFDLMPAVELIDRMAKLTCMDFFSSEIAITSGVGQPRFILIDYCNDQCDLNPQSVQPDGPPDTWVKWVCDRLAEFVWRKKEGITEPDGHGLYIAGGGKPAEKFGKISAA